MWHVVLAIVPNSCLLSMLCLKRFSGRVLEKRISETSSNATILLQRTDFFTLLRYIKHLIELMTFLFVVLQENKLFKLQRSTLIWDK